MIIEYIGHPLEIMSDTLVLVVYHVVPNCRLVVDRYCKYQ